jgi:hypothetical protein
VARKPSELDEIRGKYSDGELDDILDHGRSLGLTPEESAYFARARVEFRGPVEALPGVPFDVRVPGPAIGDLRWSALRNYDAQGELTGVTVQLLDRTERSWLEATYDAKGIREGTSDRAGEMRFLLDYDEAGRLVDIYDRAEARNPAFEPVLAQLPDRGFYADGRTLPAKVSPGPGDDPGEIARRALSGDH